MIRIAEGLSQAEVADGLGISRTYLSQVENDHKEPSLGLLRKVADLFKIPLAVLLADENEPDSEIMVQLRKMLGDILIIKLSTNEKMEKARRSKKVEKLKA